MSPSPSKSRSVCLTYAGSAGSAVDSCPIDPSPNPGGIINTFNGNNYSSSKNGIVVLPEGCSKATSTFTTDWHQNYSWWGSQLVLGQDSSLAHIFGEKDLKNHELGEQGFFSVECVPVKKRHQWLKKAGIRIPRNSNSVFHPLEGSL